MEWVLHSTLEGGFSRIILSAYLSTVVKKPSPDIVAAAHLRLFAFSWQRHAWDVQGPLRTVSYRELLLAWVKSSFSACGIHKQLILAYAYEWIAYQKVLF